jgi:hypothetical protein
MDSKLYDLRRSLPGLHIYLSSGGKRRALLYPVGQLLNPVAHMNTCISTTTLLGSVVRVNKIRVEAPLEAVPLGTKCDQEGTL